MMLIVILLVVSFGSSSNLATAYGISVSGTMLIDTLLLALVARALWPTWRWWVLPCCLLFLVGDIAFVIANGAKILQGGWFPLALGIVLFTMLRTWRRGRSEEHTSELQSLMRISYAVFCLKKKKYNNKKVINRCKVRSTK